MIAAITKVKKYRINLLTNKSVFRKTISRLELPSYSTLQYIDSGFVNVKSLPVWKKKEKNSSLHHILQYIESSTIYITTIMSSTLTTSLLRRTPTLINSISRTSSKYYSSTTSFEDSVSVTYENNNTQHQQQQRMQTTTSQSSSSHLVSPYQEIFDTISNGKTFLGTTEFQYPTIKTLKCGIPEHKLKYKTTTYGRLLEEPFVRPNEHRVTVQIAIRHIPFTNEIQQHVLKEIVGNRLNEETGILQLSSSQFGSRIENKRHVVSMLERAIESAKTLALRVEENEENDTSNDNDNNDGDEKVTS